MSEFDKFQLKQKTQIRNPYQYISQWGKITKGGFFKETYQEKPNAMFHECEMMRNFIGRFLAKVFS